MDDKNTDLAMHVEHVSENASSSIIDADTKQASGSINYDGSHEEEYHLTFGKAMAMIAFQMGYVGDLFLISMVSAVLTTINRQVGPDVNFAWMAVSQVVGSAALAAPMGRLGDIFGRRNFVMFGSVLSLIGCAVAATANSVNVIIIGVSFTGVGCSMHQLAWTCLGEIIPNKRRSLAFGFVETSLGTVAAFSAIIAYAFIENGSWRPIFWLPFAINILAFVLIFFFYRPMNQYIREEGKTQWDQLKETDFIGNFAFVAGVVLFLVGLSFGGTTFPWKSAGTLVPIILGCVTLTFLGIYESKANLKYPCFPPHLFANVRGFTVVLVGVFLYGILYYASAVIWPLQVSVLYAKTDYDIGWYSMSIGLGGLWGGPLIGHLFSKLGHTNITFTITLLILTMLSGVQAIVTPTSNISSTVICILNGAFIAGVSAESAAIIQFGAKHEFIGIVTGIMVATRGVGGAVGQTVYLSILRNRLATNIPTMVAAPLAKAGVPLGNLEVVIEDLLNGVYTSPQVTALTPAQIAVASAGIKDAYANSFRLIYLISIAFGMVAVVAAAFTRNVEKMMTDTVAVKLNEGAHVRATTDTGEGHVLGKETGEKFGDKDFI
ncbi:hypothetical protein MBLNU459_g7073t1 [Dothideomycetes sp. NU459]